LAIGDFAAGVITRYPQIRDFLETREHVGRLNILKTNQFGDLAACLSTFNDFRLWSEETSGNLSTAWGRIIKIIKRFTQLQRMANVYLGVCRIAFFERILRTADLTQLLLGFIVAALGLAWYRGLPDKSLPESAFFSTRLVLQQVRPLQCHFQSLLEVERMVADIGWRH
jgi:hypothetical protein